MKAALLTAVLLLSAMNCRSEEVVLDTGAESQVLVQQLSFYAKIIPLYRQWQLECSETYPEVSKEFEAAFKGENFSLLEKSLKKFMVDSKAVFAARKNNDSLVASTSMSKEACLQSSTAVSGVVKNLDSNKAGAEGFNKLIGFIGTLNKLPDSEMNEYVAQVYKNIINAKKEANKKANKKRSSHNKVRSQPVEKNKNYDELFNKIVTASRKSYVSGDWSIFANLYDTSSFGCFDDTEPNDSYIYLSMFPIPENATYQVFSREVQGGTESTDLSYTMTVTYETSYKSQCNESGISKRFPKKRFNMTKENGVLKLTNSYSCPGKNIENHEEFISKARAIRAKNKELKLINKDKFESALSQLTEDDWLSVPEQIKKDRFPLKTVYRIQNKYSLNYEIADKVINYICDTKNTRQ